MALPQFMRFSPSGPKGPSRTSAPNEVISFQLAHGATPTSPNQIQATATPIPTLPVVTMAPRRGSRAYAVKAQIAWLSVFTTTTSYAHLFELQSNTTASNESAWNTIAESEVGQVRGAGTHLESVSIAANVTISGGTVETPTRFRVRATRDAALAGSTAVLAETETNLQVVELSVI